MAIAAIIDVMSIQKYVYSSNKLKENIGASLIILGLFKENIREPYNKYFKSALEKGYEGGGNALLIFEDIDKENVINTIREFTLLVLVKYPGIDLGIGIDFEFDGVNLDKTYSELQISKNKFIPISTIPSHGITTECNRTGLSAEIFYESNKQASYISYSSYAKIKKIDYIKSCKYSDIMQDILLSACAGVAIAHAKYPIYRIQKIAEELLSGAKDKRKKDKDKGRNIKGDSYILIFLQKD